MIIRDELDARPGGQTAASLRSRVLLGLLADAESDRLGVLATPSEIDATARWFRTQFDLGTRAEVEDFLAFSGLDLRDFSAQMRTFTNIALLDAHHAAEISRRMPSHLALLHLERSGDHPRGGGDHRG